MLRVIASQSAKSAKEYHAQALGKEDYYSEGQEIRGEWQGIGAQLLGLSGPETTEAFNALCDNKKPGTDERLTQRNKSNRTVGYDFNFHCPKSVSVVYELTHDERILRAFRSSVNDTMREIEAEMGTRVRRHGANENRVTGNMVWAEFIHFTARPVNGVPDPHLHAHCYAFNTTWDEVEKKWKAGQFRDLKANAPYFETAFHARLSKRLADLGYRIERTAKGWELAGVPQRVLGEFSKRSRQVEEKAKELGITDARKKDGLAALTRERKHKEVSKADLRVLWQDRLSPEERAPIEMVLRQAPVSTARVSEAKAMDYAASHCYERASIVSGKDLLKTALRFGLGDVDVERVKQELKRGDFISDGGNGCQWFTTQEVLAEEKWLIEFVQNGRDQFPALGSDAYRFQNPVLSDEQRQAVLHVLRSTDRVIAIRGGAGTGKTTMMKEAVAALEANGHRVFTFAPSAEASRGVLRNDAGFANADTVEMLLQNPKPEIHGQALWIDEAGLLGARTLARVAALAERENCRLILSGDTAQHRAVERGDALRLLEKHAGLQAAELTEIRRQKSDDHKAIVASLRAGNLASAFKQLNKLGMLRELNLDNRHEALARDFAAALASGKSALVISPTHAEGARVTHEIREALKTGGKLGEDERNFVRFKNLQWTQAERGDWRNYENGLAIQFHQNAAGFQRGERVVMQARDESGGVCVLRKNGELATLPLELASRFQVYEAKEIAIAPGDMIRIVQNGFAKGKHRLNNGELKQVKGFTREGDILLSNGWVIPKDYGHLKHGYCVTSYSAQSKSVDCVFIAEGSESFRAADREQFYVSASRFKESLTIYTDNKQELLASVSKTSERPAAVELEHSVTNPTADLSKADETVNLKIALRRNVQPSPLAPRKVSGYQRSI